VRGTGGTAPIRAPSARAGVARTGACLLLAGVLAACGGGEDAPEPPEEKPLTTRGVRSAREIALLEAHRETPAERRDRAALEREVSADWVEGADGDDWDEEAAPATDDSPRQRDANASDPLDIPDPRVRAEAVMDTDAADAGGLQLLLRAMDDESPRVREAAAEQLGDSEHAEALAALIDALSDEDPDVQLAVIDALEWFDDPRAVPALLDVAERTGDDQIREAAEDAADVLDPLDPLDPE